MSGVSHLWTVGMGAGCGFSCQSRCSCFVFMDSSFTAEWWHTVLVSLMCCEILVDIWGQLGWCIPFHMSGDLICTCLVMALAWLLPPALTQEVITSVARLISLSSTVVVTILEEAVLL